MTHPVRFVEIPWDNRTIELEYSFVGPSNPVAPLIVFLHEGLGSLSLWKDFPARLCAASGFQGLVYSRPGYGRSTPVDHDTFWGTDFMHRQAYDVLPGLLAGLDINPAHKPIWLFGHSDGASIALLFGARYPELTRGMILVAPHIVVEDITVASIRKLQRSYRQDNLAAKFARHHIDPDATMRAWSRVWLDEEFLNWSILPELSQISAPVLAIQGTDDEYGTYKQIAGIAEQVSDIEVFEIPGCRHAPHRTHTEALLMRSLQFLRQRNPGIEFQ